MVAGIIGTRRSLLEARDAGVSWASEQAAQPTLETGHSGQIDLANTKRLTVPSEAPSPEYRPSLTELFRIQDDAGSSRRVMVGLDGIEPSTNRL